MISRRKGQRGYIRDEKERVKEWCGIGLNNRCFYNAESKTLMVPHSWRQAFLMVPPSWRQTYFTTWETKPLVVPYNGEVCCWKKGVIMN